MDVPVERRFSIAPSRRRFSEASPNPSTVTMPSASHESRRFPRQYLKRMTSGGRKPLVGGIEKLGPPLAIAGTRGRSGKRRRRRRKGCRKGIGRAADKGRQDAVTPLPFVPRPVRCHAYLGCIPPDARSTPQVRSSDALFTRSPGIAADAAASSRHRAGWQAMRFVFSSPGTAAFESLRGLGRRRGSDSFLRFDGGAFRRNKVKRGAGGGEDRGVRNRMGSKPGSNHLEQEISPLIAIWFGAPSVPRFRSTYSTLSAQSSYLPTDQLAIISRHGRAVVVDLLPMGKKSRPTWRMFLGRRQELASGPML